MRKYLRNIAKARLKVLGAEKVNRKMGKRNSKGNPLWKEVLFGEYAKAAEAKQKSQGVRAKRKIRRVA